MHGYAADCRVARHGFDHGRCEAVPGPVVEGETDDARCALGEPERHGGDDPRKLRELDAG